MSVEEPTKVEIEACARAGHEVNRVFCMAAGDVTHPPWEECPEWHKQSNRMQARYVLHNKYPAEAHEAWRAEKEAAGWIHGPVRDPVKKQHPALMPYTDLPVEQKAKNHLFAATVKALASALWRIPNQ